ERHVEEALDLTGVQVDSDDAVGAGRLEEVGDELGGDGLTRLDLLVLPGVAEVGDHRVDAPRRGAPQCVYEHQELHQVVVHRGAGGLDYVAVGPTNRLFNHDTRLAVGELGDGAARQRHAEVPRHARRQFGRRGAAEELEVV